MQRRPIISTEHQVEILPNVTKFHSLLDLQLPVCLEQRNGVGVQRHRSASATGLRLAKLPADMVVAVGLNLDEGADDCQPGVVKVDVAPPQAEEFSPMATCRRVQVPQ